VATLQGCYAFALVAVTGLCRFSPEEQTPLRFKNPAPHLNEVRASKYTYKLAV
jgi:hypothetical protein